MSTLYNEIDPYCAQWLRNLIDAGHIAPGVVDERDIRDLPPSYVGGFAQFHTFAGLGGWAYACRLAGWPDDRPIWTGSCPCQPFSAAGKRAGFADERHLWPAWHWLIEQCRPAIVFGEQVASASQWLGLVRGDLEALGYAVGAIPVEAASVGAPHKRDRYWFVAESAGQGEHAGAVDAEVAGAPQLVADADTEGRVERAGTCGIGAGRDEFTNGSATVALAEHCGCEGRHAQRHRPDTALPSGWWESESGIRRVVAGVSGRVAVRRATGQGAPALQEHWYNRVGALKGLGNAIVPQVGAAILKAYMECRP